MKNIIGLTGPTGSGKSSFALVAANMGITVIDCDKLSREVTRRGSECLLKLSDAFGEDIIENGELNRKLLAKRAFESEERKQQLEDIIFPFILDSVMDKIEKAQSDTVLLDAPTLYESGIDEMCGTVVAVISSFELRKKRIIERDKLTEEQAIIRMNAGKPDSFYEERADYVINNNGTQQEFLLRCEQIIKILTEE
ncbi:MAG: dephospho-CoA kinase [Acutalibacteraceae bacterium]|nr:dephospho-CoA kinase [Acutalibacteraceae bacterium]